MSLTKVLSLPPPAILGATALWLHLNYDRIPRRFPRHWDAAGRPDQWTGKTPETVYLLLVIGFLVWLLLAGLVWFGRDTGTARNIQQRRVLVAVGYHLAVVFSLIALTPLYFGDRANPWMLRVALGGLVPVLVCGFWPAKDARPGPAGWKWGFYRNAEDPRLFVRDPEAFGYSITFNFANPLSWVILGALLVVPVVLLLALRP